LELEPVPELELEPPKLKKAFPELVPVPEKFWNFRITGLNFTTEILLQQCNLKISQLKACQNLRLNMKLNMKIEGKKYYMSMGLVCSLTLIHKTNLSEIKNKN